MFVSARLQLTCVQKTHVMETTNVRTYVLRSYPFNARSMTIQHPIAARFLMGARSIDRIGNFFIPTVNGLDCSYYSTLFIPILQMNLCFLPMQYICRALASDTAGLNLARQLLRAADKICQQDAEKFLHIVYVGGYVCTSGVVTRDELNLETNNSKTLSQ